jgi:hypothetical protein
VTKDSTNVPLPWTIGVFAGSWWDLEEPGFQLLGYHISKHFLLCLLHISSKPVFFVWAVLDITTFFNFRTKKKIKSSLQLSVQRVFAS